MEESLDENEAAALRSNITSLPMMLLRTMVVAECIIKIRAKTSCHEILDDSLYLSIRF